MADPYRKVRPGERLVISARAWNRAQDAADRVLGVGTGITGGGATGADPASDIVYVSCAQSIPMFGVVGIDPYGCLTNPESVEPGVVKGIAPQAAGVFAIPLEPFPGGAVGAATPVRRCAVGGVVRVRVRVCSTQHMYANPIDGDYEKLASAAMGAVQLLGMITNGDAPPAVPFTAVFYARM